MENIFHVICTLTVFVLEDKNQSLFCCISFSKFQFESICSCAHKVNNSEFIWQPWQSWPHGNPTCYCTLFWQTCSYSNSTISIKWFQVWLSTSPSKTLLKLSKNKFLNQLWVKNPMSDQCWTHMYTRHYSGILISLTFECRHISFCRLSPFLAETSKPLTFLISW